MIRWGIIGLGKIANKFAEAIQELDNADLVSIASLTKNKLNTFGKRFNILEKYRFNTYESLLNCGEVDSVYISTLNNTHAELIIKSAKAGKNILCEKPMALNEREAKEVFIQLNESKVFFLEAIAYRCHPQTEIIVKLLQNDEIGKIKNVTSSFGFSAKKILKFFPNNRLFSRKLGGGAILDVGCYTSSFALLLAKLFKKNDDLLKFKLKNSFGSLNIRGTDDEAYTTIVFENGFEAKLNTAIRKNMNNTSLITGSKGKIIINEPWLPGKKSCIEIESKSKNYTKEITSEYSIYANTIKIASDFIIKKLKKCEYPLMTWEDSMINMRIIDEWKNSLNKN